MDLDTLAWQASTPPERKPLDDSQSEIEKFVDSNEAWVIEGCYADLLHMAVSKSNEMIFMNLSIETCLANARNRAWEPHKYESKQTQDANLEMLLKWIAQYSQRTDTFSESSHSALFSEYPGKKIMFTSNRNNDVVF